MPGPLGAVETLTPEMVTVLNVTLALPLTPSQEARVRGVGEHAGLEADDEDVADQRAVVDDVPPTEVDERSRGADTGRELLAEQRLERRVQRRQLVRRCDLQSRRGVDRRRGRRFHRGCRLRRRAGCRLRGRGRARRGGRRRLRGRADSGWRPPPASSPPRRGLRSARRRDRDCGRWLRCRASWVLAFSGRRGAFLLRVLHGSRLADDRDLDLTRVGQLLLDLLDDVAGQA